MENSDLTKGGTFTNEMKIDFDVFCSLVLDRIGSEIHNTHIVTIYDHSRVDRTVELKKEVTVSSGFSYGICDSALYCFST